MKRLSNYQKEKWIRSFLAKQRKRKRRLYRKRGSKYGNYRSHRSSIRQLAIRTFNERLRFGDTPVIEDRPDEGRIALICPQELNVTANFRETMGFFCNLQEFIHLQRRRKKRTKYIDFSKLKTIDIGSLLGLAAELDMALGPDSRHRYRRELLPADVHLWQPGIAYLFQEFGILELTGYRPREAEDKAIVKHPYLTPVRFRRDPFVKGSLANDLVEEIAALAPEHDEEQGGKLYTALTEAMTNTNMHAYPREFINYPGRTKKCWWGGALYDSASETAQFVIYDRGIGLPNTIPKQPWAKRLIDGGANTDAGLIKAAILESRSATGASYHGKGLRQMAEAVDHRPNSRLKIISGKAVVNYQGSNKITTQDLPIEFGGTLIEWFICSKT